MSLYEASVPQFIKMLKQFGKWIDAGVAFAQKKSFDPSVLLGYRLAPDQYPLLRQVQSACDAAKGAAARLSGKDPPKHPDDEKTIDEVHARFAKVIQYLDGFTPGDFNGSETRLIELPFLEGKVIQGRDYLTGLALPNFYFHVTTGYAILRHAGVDLGKRDFLGSLELRDK